MPIRCFRSPGEALRIRHRVARGRARVRLRSSLPRAARNARLQLLGIRRASLAVVQALADTLAVFYRLRILHTYQRKRALVGTVRLDATSNFAPSVALLTPEPAPTTISIGRDLDVVATTPGERVSDAARRATAELVAVIEADAVPSGNFVSATVPFLARDGVGAVVTSKVAPATGSLRARGAAAVRESRVARRLALYFRFLPGNIRYVTDFPTARSFVVRRLLLLELASHLNRSEYPGGPWRSGETWWSTHRRRSLLPSTRTALPSSICAARWPTGSIAARRSPGVSFRPPNVDDCRRAARVLPSLRLAPPVSCQERRRSGGDDRFARRFAVLVERGSSDRFAFDP